jgi:hypothetical protein
MVSVFVMRNDDKKYSRRGLENDRAVITYSTHSTPTAFGATGRTQLRKLLLIMSRSQSKILGVSAALLAGVYP